MRHADGLNADRCFEAMRQASVAPDAASFEYLIKTKCAAFDARGAWAAHSEMEREYLEATPQALAALATVSSITGDVAGATKACAAAKAAIEANGAGVVASADGSRGDGLFSSLDDDLDGAENDEPERERPPGPGAGNMSESVRAFLRLRNSDAARQVADVEAFLAKGEAHVAAVAADVRAGHASASSPVKVVEGEGPVLDFRKLFRGGKSTDETLRPVKLEVCSGMGDWVVSRAAADARSADWLAIEMRRNRVRMTWAKGVRARLNNLAVLRGMAHEMLSSRVPEDSLSEIYVNYPDPPEWVGQAPRREARWRAPRAGAGRRCPDAGDGRRGVRDADVPRAVPAAGPVRAHRGGREAVRLRRPGGIRRLVLRRDVEERAADGPVLHAVPRGEVVSTEGS